MQFESLDSLSDFLALSEKASPYTDAHYPPLRNLDGEDRFAFSLTHSLRHIHKTTGRIETVLEAYEHGKLNALNREKLTEFAMDELFSALRLAELVGVTPKSLEGYLRIKFPHAF